MIKRLSENETFKTLAQISKTKQEKMEDVELVLRYFALTDGRYLSYKPHMKDFLNQSMEEFSKLNEPDLHLLEQKFLSAFKDIEAKFGRHPFAKWRKDEDKHTSYFNAAVYDAVIVAHDNSDTIPQNAAVSLRKLFEDDSFQDLISGSINDASKLFGRIRAVEEAIASGH